MTVATWTPDTAPLQGLGLMRLSDDGWGDDDRDPARLVRAAVDAGVSLLDTAEMYGNEEVVGRALGGCREDVTLCSKFGVYWGPSDRMDDWSVRADPATVRSAIDGSLRRLGVDHLDLYYLHHRSEDTPIEETVGAMAELHRAGKIGALGLSNVTLDDIRRAHAVHPIAAVQLEWSLAQRSVETLVPTLADLGIALVAYSPLGHGSLTHSTGNPLAHVLADIAARVGATRGQIALAWVHHRGRRAGCAVVPLPGTTSITHLHANIAAARIELTETDVRNLEDAASSHPVRPVPSNAT
jgi:aryl-alcohol dehydrogenase-like predicted oxidoreductase